VLNTDSTVGNLVLQDQKRTKKINNNATIIYRLRDLQYNNSRCIAEEDLFSVQEMDYINQHL